MIKNFHDKGEKMDKNFSEGFIHDIADLMLICVDKDTDNLAIELDINGKTLEIEISFKIKDQN